MLCSQELRASINVHDGFTSFPNQAKQTILYNSYPSVPQSGNAPANIS